MVKAVIFDRDGVLVDSEFTNVRAAELAFAQFGISLKQSDKDWIVSRHPDDYLPKILRGRQIDVEQYKRFQRQYYYEVLETTPVFEDTIRLLRSIYEQGVWLGLCTSASLEGTLKILGRLGITDLFRAIITKEDYGRRKPDPEPYLVSAQKLHVEPSECVVIEDSEVGLRAATAAGMRCVVIYNSYTKHHNFMGAATIVDSATKINLPDLLGKPAADSAP